MPRAVRVLALWTVALSMLALAGCTSAPPRDANDLCAIFDERPSWRSAAREVEARWGTPVALGMAIIRHESSFRADAKPPRERLLGIVPWFRPSSAYGYAQATDEAWEDYLAATGHFFVSRTDFADSLDFVGWYTASSQRRFGISWGDSFRHYLVYHEGFQGYANGGWRSNASLQRFANTVADRAKRYEAALQRCP